jgi:hypothetical protein
VTSSTVTVRNSIIANSPHGGEVWGALTDGGYNVCSDGSANLSAVGSINNVDPLLSALSDNGGPTATMALLAGSPARDAIPSGYPPTDQRGVTRPQGTAADMGAFEADFISAAPTILTQPQGGTVRAGTNVLFTVAASGTQPLLYEWRKDGRPLTGASTSSLLLANVQAVDAGTYSVTVSNSVGGTLSEGAVLTVDSTPLILSQPASVTVAPGAMTNFSVVADGPELTYEWFHEGISVPGGTSSTLTITSALTGAQGTYFVVVSNFATTTMSSNATLTFDASALNIVVPPKSASVEAGGQASFNVLASGIPPFAYQWRHKGSGIEGATESSLTLPAVNAAAGGDYDVVVTNGYRSVTSVAAQLTVLPGPIPPQLIPNRVGNSLTITFNAEGGRQYRLLSATNLNVWSPVATNTAVLAGPLQFVQPITTAPEVQYRVVTP